MIVEDRTLTIKAIEKAGRKEFMELYRSFLRVGSESEAAECLEQLRAYNTVIVDGIRFYEPEAMALRKRIQEARQNG